MKCFSKLLRFVMRAGITKRLFIGPVLGIYSSSRMAAGSSSLSR